MKLTTLLGLLSLSLAACATDGEDGPSSANRPSPQQSASLFAAATSGLDAAKTEAIGNRASLRPDTITVDHAGPCELGGTFDISGTYDYSLASAASEWDLDTQFTACAVPGATLDGNLAWTQSMTAGGNIVQTITGSLSLVAPEGTASCLFDLTIETGSLGVRTRGTVCGYDVDADLGL